MKHTHRAFSALLVVFSLTMGSFTPVFASSDAGEETRFFVRSTKAFWKNALGVRNEFSNGFTTEAGGLQLTLAKVMLRGDVVPVERLNILPEETPEPAGRGGVPGKPTPTDGPDPSPEARPAPTAQVPWGVGMLYDGTESVPSGGADVAVAILDTGYQAHPDLDRRIADCKDFSHRRAPVVEGSCKDDNGHGSHVAGIIAADGGADGAGIYGMAPEASLHIYKVCGKSGSCWADDIATAIRQAADANLQVLNLSLGADSSSALIADAIAYATEAGVLVVAAAGNDGPYEDSIDYPGALVQTVAVGALDDTTTVANWSSRGINESTTQGVIEEHDLELAAPGVNIESTYHNGGYAILSGTSMAAPHVAGLAAKVWQGNAADTRDLLHSLTLGSVDLGEPGDDNAYGWGLPQF